MKKAMALTKDERAELLRQAEDRKHSPSSIARKRAKVILLLAAGQTWTKVMEEASCSRSFVDTWSRRFQEKRLDGLTDERHAKTEVATPPPDLERRILDATQEPPPDGDARWSTRALGAKLGVSHMKIQRVWLKHGISPTREASAAKDSRTVSARSSGAMTNGRINSARERILREAAAVIRTTGPKDIGITEIMTNAGMSPGSFYTHFKSKDQLISHAMGYMFDQRYGTFVSYVQLNDQKPDVAIKSFVAEYLSPEHRDAPESGCPIPVMAAELPRLQALARQQFGFGVDRLVEGISTLLTRMGISRPKPQARVLLAELVGALSLARAIPDREEADEFLQNSKSAIYARLKPPAGDLRATA